MGRSGSHHGKDEQDPSAVRAGKAGASIIGEDYPSFDLWLTLADYFLQDVFKKEK